MGWIMSHHLSEGSVDQLHGHDCRMWSDTKTANVLVSSVFPPLPLRRNGALALWHFFCAPTTVVSYICRNSPRRLWAVWLIRFSVGLVGASAQLLCKRKVQKSTLLDNAWRTSAMPAVFTKCALWAQREGKLTLRVCTFGDPNVWVGASLQKHTFSCQGCWLGPHVLWGRCSLRYEAEERWLTCQLVSKGFHPHFSCNFCSFHDWI